MSDILSKALLQKTNKMVGDLSGLQTTAKDNIVNSLNENAEKIGSLQKNATAEFSILAYDNLKVAVSGGYDYAPVLQAANNAIVATGKRGVLKLNGLNFKVNSTVTIDISYVSIDGGGATLDASGLASGSAIKVIGTRVENGFTTIDHHAAFFDAIILKGDINQSRGKVGTVGIEFDSSGESGASRLNLYSFIVAHFEKNIVFKNRAYVINFFGGNTSKAEIGIHTPSGQLDAGERISFFGFTIGNCTTLVKGENPDGSLHFDTCSFDYPSGKFFEINGTQVFLSNCHIEGAGNVLTSAPITLTGNGATLSMKGGKFMMNSTTPSYPNIFSIQASTDSSKGGGVFIDGVFMFNLQPTTGIAASGNGYISMSNWFSYDSTQLFSILSTANNALIDGGFEQSSIIDNWFIVTDAAAVSNKLTGTNLSLVSSTDYAKVGTKSLKVSKTAVGGSPAQFAIAVPINEAGKRYGALFNYKKVGTGTGSMYLDMKWGIVENNTSGIPVAKYASSTLSSRTITFDSTDVDWTSATFSPKVRRPDWATHVLVYFNISGLSNGTTFYLDDCLFSKM